MLSHSHTSKESGISLNERSNEVTYMTAPFELTLDGGKPLEDKELLLAVGGRVGLFVEVACGSKEAFIEVKDVAGGGSDGCPWGGWTCLWRGGHPWFNPPGFSRSECGCVSEADVVCVCCCREVRKVRKMSRKEGE